jgi:uncharacterized oligopeptide transporter (OPT) family protein
VLMFFHFLFAVDRDDETLMKHMLRYSRVKSSQLWSFGLKCFFIIAAFTFIRTAVKLLMDQTNVQSSETKQGTTCLNMDLLSMKLLFIGCFEENYKILM